MFGLFNNKKTNCPIPEDTRIWMENALIWLINQFGEEKILKVNTLIPSVIDFPVKFDGSEQSAIDTSLIVAKQMDIDPSQIVVDFFNNQLLEIKNGMGGGLHGQQYDNEIYPAAIYNGKTIDNKFSISIEISQIKSPETLIPLLSHEMAHIKILGENRLTENDEYLTDLVTVFFGLGIFNANAAFKFKSDPDYWSYNKLGYLSQQEWGYALALYAYIKNETDSDWLKFLSPNIKSDFKKSIIFILNNTDKVLI